MKALTAAEMRQVDLLTTERYGIPSLQLMENAGTRFFEFLRSSYGDLAASHAAVLCGKGNNGGDGFVAARLLQEKGLKPVVYLFSRDRKSTRLNSSHGYLSYAVFCLQKKKTSWRSA